MVFFRWKALGPSWSSHFLPPACPCHWKSHSTDSGQHHTNISQSQKLPRWQQTTLSHWDRRPTPKVDAWESWKMHNCTLCGRVWALQGGFSDALAPLNINTNELHACTRLTPLSAKKKSPEGKAKLANKEKTSQFESWQYFENDTKRHRLVAQCSCTRWLQQTHTCRRANSFSMAFIEGRALLHL